MVELYHRQKCKLWLSVFERNCTKLFCNFLYVTCGRCFERKYFRFLMALFRGTIWL